MSERQSLFYFFCKSVLADQKPTVEHVLRRECETLTSAQICEKHKKLPATHQVATLTVDRWRNVVLMKRHVAVPAQHPVTEFRHRV